MSVSIATPTEKASGIVAIICKNLSTLMIRELENSERRNEQNFGKYKYHQDSQRISKVLKRNRLCVSKESKYLSHIYRLPNLPKNTQKKPRDLITALSVP